MKPWQFNVLFGIAAAGSVFLLFAKSLGIEIDPTALTGFGAILTYVLTQRGQLIKKERDEKKKRDKGDDAE